MKPLQPYRIPFSGLKTGKHQFEYEIDHLFFDQFVYSIVKNGRLRAAVELEKQETFIILQFHIFGEIELNCDRCLANYFHKIDIKERLIVKFGEDKNWDDDTEEVIVLTKNDYEIDVSLPLYEYITVAVPYVTRCEDVEGVSSCDQEMMNKLKTLSNKAHKQSKDDAMDPRWDALKQIINKN
ncbi:MAG: DUF177 domain-containing protein [Sphingobacteriaceae bacterium]|nr:MAG: DUF177 domain-containing protein [Pedobacter sp.]